jgi:hypothetical protein
MGLFGGLAQPEHFTAGQMCINCTLANGDGRQQMDYGSKYKPFYIPSK